MGLLFNFNTTCNKMRYFKGELYFSGSNGHNSPKGYKICISGVTGQRKFVNCCAGISLFYHS